MSYFGDDDAAIISGDGKPGSGICNPENVWSRHIDQAGNPDIVGHKLSVNHELQISYENEFNFKNQVNHEKHNDYENYINYENEDSNVYDQSNQNDDFVTDAMDFTFTDTLDDDDIESIVSIESDQDKESVAAVESLVSVASSDVSVDNESNTHQKHDFVDFAAPISILPIRVGTEDKSSQGIVADVQEGHEGGLEASTAQDNINQSIASNDNDNGSLFGDHLIAEHTQNCNTNESVASNDNDNESLFGDHIMAEHAQNSNTNESVASNDNDNESLFGDHIIADHGQNNSGEHSGQSGKSNDDNKTTPTDMDNELEALFFEADDDKEPDESIIPTPIGGTKEIPTPRKAGVCFSKAPLDADSDIKPTSVAPKTTFGLTLPSAPSPESVNIDIESALVLKNIKKKSKKEIQRLLKHCDDELMTLAKKHHNMAIGQALKDKK